jgi:mono/diheme cytochrome c family protein
MARMIFAAAAIGGALAVAVGVATAEPLTYELPPETAVLKPGAGVEVAQNNCLACHSVDYIAMQPPKKGKAFWDAEVTKMNKTYHAPIDEADAKAISNYLAQTY